MKKIENLPVATGAMAVLICATFLSGVVHVSEAIDPFQPKSASSDKKLITTADIADNAVTSPKIKDGEVTTADIADSSITKQKLDPNAAKLVVSSHTKTARADPNTSSFVDAECDSGEILTGGGFDILNDASPILEFSIPRGNAWTVGIFNSSPSPVDYLSVAMCAHLELGP